MNRGSLSALVGRLRHSARVADARGLTDADLLRRWLGNRDEAAFELLVWRHGRLVLSVCRRMLDRAQDVEDAFQATFLVLLRKANGISHKQALAAWLYTVAYRIAAQARERAARLPEGSAALDQLPGTEQDAVGGRELRRVLDEEVNRLPDKYRLPFLLCHLEGKTNEEAAHELGCPVGTVLSRLSRARDRLRQRLTRRGVAPGVALVGPLVVGEVVSAELVSSTARAAVAVAAVGAAGGVVSAPVAVLMEGVIRTMFIAKVKASLAVVLTVSIVGVSGGLGYHTVIAQDEGGGAKTSGSGPAKQADNLPPETRELMQLVEMLTRELQQTQDRAEVLQAKLKHVQDQLGMRRKNPPAKASLFSKEAVPPRNNPDLEDARDQLELLKVRLQGKEADLNSAKAMLQESRLRLAGAEKAARNAPGTISRDELGAAKVTVDKYFSEVVTKEAAFLEAQILFRQAERRVKRMTDSGSPAASTLEQRVAELERQVNEMRRQMGGGVRYEGAKTPKK